MSFFSIDLPKKSRIRMLEAIVNNGYNKVSGNGEVAFIKPILPHITIINSRQNMKKKLSKGTGEW